MQSIPADDCMFESNSPVGIIHIGPTLRTQICILNIRVLVRVTLNVRLLVIQLNEKHLQKTFPDWAKFIVVTKRRVVRNNMTLRRSVIQFLGH